MTTDSSWLNPAENWLSKLQRHIIAREDIHPSQICAAN